MPDLYESRERKKARENAALEILSVDELRKLIEQVEAAIVRYDRADLKIINSGRTVTGGSVINAIPPRYMIAPR
jgi:uncharacterized small protein (DUF1192 family)